MDKNRKFTVTWNELESLVEGLVTEQLHKYGIFNESWDSSSEDGFEEEYIEELYHLIDLYEKGEICTNDEDEDYGIQHNIRHFRRGDNESDPEDLYNQLKRLHLECLIQQWEEGDIYTDDEETENTVNDWIEHYKNGDENFDSEQLYNWLND